MPYGVFLCDMVQCDVCGNLVYVDTQRAGGALLVADREHLASVCGCLREDGEYPFYGRKRRVAFLAH